MFLANADRRSELVVDLHYRQLHILRTRCGFSHAEALRLTVAERGAWVDIANRMYEEATQAAKLASGAA